MDLQAHDFSLMALFLQPDVVAKGVMLALAAALDGSAMTAARFSCRPPHHPRA